MPGLITIALLYGAFLFANPDLLDVQLGELAELSNWVLGGAAVTCMVLTQALGILLEKRLIDGEHLSKPEIDVTIPPGIDPHGVTTFTLRPYHEYEGIYLLLAELRDNEDTQGHLKRILAQFFLTNNTLVSFAAGMAATLLLLVFSGRPELLAGGLYLAALGACLVVTFKVAKIRFQVMAKGLWAARRRRLLEAKQ